MTGVPTGPRSQSHHQPQAERYCVYCGLGYSPAEDASWGWNCLRCGHFRGGPSQLLPQGILAHGQPFVSPYAPPPPPPQVAAPTTLAAASSAGIIDAPAPTQQSRKQESGAAKATASNQGSGTKGVQKSKSKKAVKKEKKNAEVRTSRSCSSHFRDQILSRQTFGGSQTPHSSSETAIVPAHFVSRSKADSEMCVGSYFSGTFSPLKTISGDMSRE